MEPILTTRNIAIGYSANNVLADGISLELRRGNLIALCGSNGIGKSTLLRTLNGLHHPISGTISVGGQSPEKLSPKERAKLISLVLTEKPSAGLTVRELVALGRQPYTNWIGTLREEDHAAIDKAITLTGIGYIADKLCDQISDGQLQMTMIARALAQDTPLIMLDEPTTHLDIPNKFALLDLLRNLAHAENKCVIFSTHDIEPALSYCDGMILMFGKSAVQKTVNELASGEVLQQLFADRQVTFDAENVKFVFKKNRS